MDANQDTSKGSKEWVTKHFEWSIEKIQELDSLLHLTMMGLSGIKGYPRVLMVVTRVKEYLEESTGDEEKDIESATKNAKLAETEIQNEFPIAHAQAVVMLWAYLEATVGSFIAEWIASEPNAYSVREIRRLKVELGDYIGLDDDQKHFYVYQLLEQNVAAGIRYGVSRFESILAPFGLSGEVDEEVRKNIYELGQIRNVLLHRGGLADARMVSNCPWLGLNRGEAVKVTHKQYAKYRDAVIKYLCVILMRAVEALGGDMSKFSDDDNFV